ncbi:MAG: endonuclease MutS2 [Clostridia bacterium]|nr:endonuclease MutS2 [Clostridia bacterium]
MNEKTLATLEFNKILNMLMTYTKNEKVIERIEKLCPETDIENVKKMLRETTEAQGVLLRRGAPPAFTVNDVCGAVKRCERGGVLSMKELLSLSSALATARRIKGYIEEDKIGKETDLYSLAESIINLKQLENEINDKIISENEMADGASPALFAIRRKMKSQEEKIRDTLNSIISSTKFQKFLQDPIITMRSDRFVVPVKAEYKNEIKGIVHDFSASGSTVFIEPVSVVEMTNEIAELRGKEKEEIERVLYELAGVVSESSNEILTDYKIIYELDFIFCKARLSVSQKGVEPKLNDEGRIIIKKGRHPLLDKNKVVPIDISLGDEYDTLIITGPNTGGKTVSLKTLGLFTLMAQSGLHISADTGSEIAVFENVFADIGDEQSIEQNLSTFSSHIVNLVDITNKVTPNSLVLADELGAGTDPTEGAALAISIIEYLRGFGAKVAATTHYTELKMYALTEEGVENASCEFDLATLSPTYRLMIGVPGKSNAFAISKRLGLNETVIENAKNRLSGEDIKLEDVISGLERSRKQAETDRIAAEQASRDARIFKENMRRELDSLEEKKAKLMQKARADAMAIVESAKRNSQEAMRELKEIKNSSVYKEALKLAEGAKAKLKEESDKILGGVNSEKPKVKTLKSVKLGQTVRIISLDTEGSVLSLPDKKGTLFVQAGIMKIKTNLTDLTSAKPNEKERKSSSKAIAATFKAEKKTSLAMEKDVRGMTLDEAVLEVDKFLDDCYISSLHEVTIIHGKGTGVLRAGIGDFLRTHPCVKSYRAGRYGEGEMGVTVVTLKDR